MKLWARLALLCAAAWALCAAAAEGVIYVNDDLTCLWHRSPDCALASDDLLEDPASAADAPDWNIHPCPACVPDAAEAPGVEAWERGGTVVIRVPDRDLEAMLAPGGWGVTAPDALIHDAKTDDGDIARLIHGQAYLDFLENAREGEPWPATACLPEYVPEPDGLLMSRRHLGAAWYLVVRPDKPYDGGDLAQRLDLYRVPLSLTRWAAGATVDPAGVGLLREETLEIAPKKSGGEIVFEDRGDSDGGNSLYVVRDGGVNVLVIREKCFDPTFDRIRRVEFCHSEFTLYGYADGEDAVYVCAITDGELEALRERAFFPMREVNAEAEEGEAAAEAALLPGYAPAASATLPDGTFAAMDQPEYPIGTAFVSATLTRPEGGVAPFHNQAPLQRLSDGRWKPVGDVNLMGRIDGDPSRERGGWFCDEVHIVYPTKPFGALREGLYRLWIDSTEAEDGDDRVTWLEFRVCADAPAPTMPAPVERPARVFPLNRHATPHDDPAAYHSCTDNTRLRFGSEHTRLLAGDTVYELRGIDESWGWGIGSHYSLFAWPVGRPEAARLLIEDIDESDMTMYDLGDGLLLRDSDGDFYRCDGGGHLLHLGRLFEDRQPPFAPATDDGEDFYILDMLLVGDGAYLATQGGVWYTELEDFDPKPVYRAKEWICNSDAGGGFLVYDAGVLLIAEPSGIVAVDALAEAGSDGLPPAKRLTDDYDPDDGANGFGYIALNGRLYCWSAKEKATVSMQLDGGDLQIVSKERFWFNQVNDEGVVLALTGAKAGMFGDERTGAAFYDPPDPENPSFDPEHGAKRDIAPGRFEYLSWE